MKSLRWERGKHWIFSNARSKGMIASDTNAPKGLRLPGPGTAIEKPEILGHCPVRWLRIASKNTQRFVYGLYNDERILELSNPAYCPRAKHSFNRLLHLM